MWPEVESVLRAKSPSVRVEPTELGQIARQAKDFAGQADLVVAAGGDGTIHGVGQGLIGTDAVLGVIPMGTGNDLARTLGIPLDPVQAARSLFQSRPTPIDAILYRCEGGEGCCLNVAGVGFDASVAQRINHGFRFLKGTSAYLAAVGCCLATYRPVQLSISLDGTTLEADAMLCAIANAQYYGGGMKIAPEAKIDDGWIDVIVVRGISKLEFLRQFPRVFRGSHLSHPAVQSFRCKRVGIESRLPIPILADGEIVGSTPAEFEIAPRALRVAMPG